LFKPRDPDIVARHPQHGWRFCEVKWKRDRLHDGQLETLAFLHCLLGAKVEVVRVVSEGPRVKSASAAQLDCTFEVFPPTKKRMKRI
jgi:hypothetical protein